MSFQGLENLENLRKLNLNNNEIVYSEDYLGRSEKAFDCNLTKLCYLAISNNKISSLKFINKLPSIIELYASFNQLKNLRDIFHLKPLNVLAVLVFFWFSQSAFLLCFKCGLDFSKVFFRFSKIVAAF